MVEFATKVLWESKMKCKRYKISEIFQYTLTTYQTYWKYYWECKIIEFVTIQSMPFAPFYKESQNGSYNFPMKLSIKHVFK